MNKIKITSQKSRSRNRIQVREREGDIDRHNNITVLFKILEVTTEMTVLTFKLGC